MLLLPEGEGRQVTLKCDQAIERNRELFRQEIAGRLPGHVNLSALEARLERIEATLGRLERVLNLLDPRAVEVPGLGPGRLL